MFLVQLVSGSKKITVNLDNVAYITDGAIEFTDSATFLAINPSMHRQLLEAAFGRGQGPTQVAAPSIWDFQERTA